MNTLFARFVQDESGATAIEYALIAVLIAVVAIGAMTLLGSNVTNKFSNVAASIQ